jgi:class 3 adenylate cyclase/tetratricopeptide (TPR) repeat protein
VLFCDLAGSTAISASLDPEDWRAAVAAYHRAAAEAVTRYGGHVAKYLGDGVMAFFGYPEAHDNDAERAVRAGLALLDALVKLNENVSHPRLAARIGIDSGAVVVGTGAGPDADVFGDTPNIAARVEATAAPGTVLVSANTHRLISGMFVVEDCGAQVLKGVEQSLQLYRIIRSSGMRGRLEAAAASRGLTQFVGREDELRSLMSRWERACDGEGQVALIIGEAGIGKSRLVHRFHEAIAGTPHTLIEAGAGAFFQNTPFYPVTEMLRQFLGNSPAEDQITQLERRLIAAGLKPVEALPLIAPLLNLALPPEYSRSPLPPDQQRRRLLATLVEWVLGSARAQPLIIATEDLHWVDPSTLELIQLLVEQGAHARLLLLYTARPEFHPPWPLRSHHAQINLNRLSARDIRTMVAQVAAQKALADETVTAVVERTGGVPLFVEELTRSLLESGHAKLTGRAIPATLHDSLMARLDRLGPAKEVIQVGAVLGSKFSYELLHAVHPLNDGQLEGHLRTLTDAELLYARGLAPEATYQFKHALIRDAAYEALLKSRRKELHRLVAQTIDSQFPTLKENHPEVLARHWTEAGETESAIMEWSRAGEQAEARDALKEALESYEQALAVLAQLPASPERDGREFQLRRLVVGILFVIRGYAAAETSEPIERAAVLAEKNGDLKSLVLMVVSKWASAITSGKHLAAATLSDQTLELALREGSPTSLGSAHAVRLMTLHYRGDLVGAENHFSAGLAYFDDVGFRQMPGASTITFGVASWNAWMLGRADVARERESQMIAAANSNNPYDMAGSGFLAAYLYICFRDYVQAETLAARALQLSEKNQFPQHAANSRGLLGLARAQLGRVPEGIGLLRRGIADVLDTGSPGDIGGLTTGLAVAQELGGDLVNALETIEQALQANPDELPHRPEIFRVRGEIRLKLAEKQLAEADFRNSIALAQSMSAKSWELRSTMSLARLLRDTGRGAEAYTMLSSIYNWFTEGFDTADLKDAKALLDELSG